MWCQLGRRLDPLLMFRARSGACSLAVVTRKNLGAVATSWANFRRGPQYGQLLHHNHILLRKTHHRDQRTNRHVPLPCIASEGGWK